MDKEMARDNLNNAFAFFNDGDGNIIAAPKVSHFLFIDHVVLNSIWAILGKDNCKSGGGYIKSLERGERVDGAIVNICFSTEASKILSEAGVSIPGIEQRTKSIKPARF